MTLSTSEFVIRPVLHLVTVDLWSTSRLINDPRAYYIGVAETETDGLIVVICYPAV